MRLLKIIHDSGRIAVICTPFLAILLSLLRPLSVSRSWENAAFSRFRSSACRHSRGCCSISDYRMVSMQHRAVPARPQTRMNGKSPNHSPSCVLIHPWRICCSFSVSVIGMKAMQLISKATMKNRIRQIVNQAAHSRLRLFLAVGSGNLFVMASGTTTTIWMSDGSSAARILVWKPKRRYGGSLPAIGSSELGSKQGLFQAHVFIHSICSLTPNCFNIARQSDKAANLFVFF